jgi:hypothetical protein
LRRSRYQQCYALRETERAQRFFKQKVSGEALIAAEYVDALENPQLKAQVRRDLREVKHAHRHGSSRMYVLRKALPQAAGVQVQS